MGLIQTDGHHDFGDALEATEEAEDAHRPQQPQHAKSVFFKVVKVFLKGVKVMIVVLSTIHKDALVPNGSNAQEKCREGKYR